MTIENVRQWIAVCESAGIEMPEQIVVLDTYARLLEARIYSLSCDKEAGT